MYEARIVNGNDKITIHDCSGKNTVPKLTYGIVKKEVNAIPSFAFRIPPNNPGYTEILHRKTKVIVEDLKNNKTVFEGRVYISTPSMSEDGTVEKEVICEGIKAYLHDSIQPYEEEKYWTGDTDRTGLEEFIDFILANHNTQVEENKRIYRGRVTVHPFAESDNITKGLNYEDTYECLESKLIASFGGEIDVRRGNDGLLYLDYVEQLGVTKNIPITVGVNIQSMSQAQNSKGLATRLFLLGC